MIIIPQRPSLPLHIAAQFLAVASRSLCDALRVHFADLRTCQIDWLTFHKSKRRVFPSVVHSATGLNGNLTIIITQQQISQFHGKEQDSVTERHAKIACLGFNPIAGRASKVPT